MIQILERRLTNMEIGYDIVKGSMSSGQRQKAILKFKENDHCEFLIVSIRAGATGLNLTNANNVMILDPWWNPSQEEQAIARVHRIGQEKEVNVYKFFIKNSIEERIVKMHEKKLMIASEVMMQKHQSENSSSSKTNELLSLLIDT